LRAAAASRKLSRVTAWKAFACRLGSWLTRVSMSSRHSAFVAGVIAEGFGGAAWAAQAKSRRRAIRFLMPFKTRQGGKKFRARRETGGRTAPVARRSGRRG
jgi:hypothetical protein